MNQKFLSKSSWSIRGGNSNSSSNNNSSSSSNNTANNRLNNGNNYRLQPTSVPYNNVNYGMVSINGNKQTPNSSILQGKHRQANASHNGTLPRHTGDDRQTYSPTNVTKYKTTSQFDSTVSASHFQEDKLVIQPSSYSQNNSALKNSKRMSHSITDLRELKEKPKKTYNWVDESDEFQHEIKERRIDMYIAEIEMEPLFQLGSTIR